MADYLVDLSILNTLIANACAWFIIFLEIHIDLDTSAL
jgi:hypothetical protein